MHHVIKQGSVQDGRSIKLLPGNRRSNNCKNSRPNHRANAQRSQRKRSQGLLEFAIRLLRIRNQFVDGLATDKLIARGLRQVVIANRLSQETLSPQIKLKARALTSVPSSKLHKHQPKGE